MILLKRGIIQSFLSFIPRDLNKEIRNKLLNFYISKLFYNTKLHDKIESEIVFSNYSHKFHNQIKSTNLSPYETAKLKGQLIKVKATLLKDKVWYEFI